MDAWPWVANLRGLCISFNSRESPNPGQSPMNRPGDPLAAAGALAAANQAC